MSEQNPGDIKPEDLHPTYQVLAALVGVENTLIIGRELGGTQIYLPKLDIEQIVLHRGRAYGILQEFNGHNYAELARKYKASDRYVRKILEKQATARRQSLAPQAVQPGKEP